MFLSDAELQRMTGKSRNNARARALAAMGVEFRQRPDGALLVLRSHVEDIMGAKPRTQRPASQPDWSGLGATKA